jgi:hypothetical protein
VLPKLGQNPVNHGRNPDNRSAGKSYDRVDQARPQPAADITRKPAVDITGTDHQHRPPYMGGAMTFRGPVSGV